MLENLPNISLSDQLASMGWSHQPSKTRMARDVYDENRQIVGSFTYDECWEHLRKMGMV